MSYVVPDDMPEPQTITTENDGLRVLLSTAAGIIQADDLLCCRMIIMELRQGLQSRTKRTRYRTLAITALEEAEHWLMDASAEE